MDKVLKWAKDVRSVWVLLGMMWMFAAWAIDTQFVSHGELDVHSVAEIRRSISEFEIRKSFSEDPKEIRMYETIIKVKENHIKEIKNL